MDLPERSLLIFSNCSDKDYLFKHNLSITTNGDDIIIETQLKDEIIFKGIRLVFKKEPVRNARTYRATDDAGHEFVLSVNNDEYIITRLSDNISFFFHEYSIDMKDEKCTKQKSFEFLKHLYHLRDFEIKNLWQRSIFLAGFIGLFFTGYGKVVFEMLDCCKPLELLNLIALAICLLGFVFSILWTMMAKGSKAWYEVYEKKIELLESKLEIPADYKNDIKNNDQVMPEKMDKCLISTKSGPYSVSKINIIIGIFLQAIWFILFVFHAIFHFKNIDIQTDVVIALITLFIVILIFSLINKIGTKSKTLCKKR